MNLGSGKHLSVVLALQLSLDASSGINSQVSSYSHVHRWLLPKPNPALFPESPSLGVLFRFQASSLSLAEKIAMGLHLAQHPIHLHHPLKAPQ